MGGSELKRLVQQGTVTRTDSLFEASFNERMLLLHLTRANRQFDRPNALAIDVPAFSSILNHRIWPETTSIVLLAFYRAHVYTEGKER